MSTPPVAKFTPTTTELNQAIEKVLKKGRTDSNDVLTTLKKEHPEWKLQPRRVAKFVKRQKSGRPVGNDDDSVTPSLGPVRRWYKNRAAKKTTGTATLPMEAPPLLEEEKVAEPLLPKETEEEEPQLLPDTPKEGTRGLDFVGESSEPAKNDCTWCQGCAIL